MAFEVHCGKCGARFTLPDDLYERKVKGRVVTVRCKRCRADIGVDGTELASRPGGEAPVDETPTVPLASVRALAAEGLWLVSYGEDDDRELTPRQIKKALADKEIDGNTLVWNAGMDEWLSIREVPDLAKHVPEEDETGGFLGTGAHVSSEVKEPALRSSSRPPPMPSAEENDILGDDEIGPFRSVSAGTLQVPEAPAESKPEPAPETPKTGEKIEPEAKPKEAAPTPPAKPSKDLPKPPTKAKPVWLSEPPEAADDDEEPPPSSGTPDLRSLTTTLKPSSSDEDVKPNDEVSEDIFALGGGAITAQLPAIDLSALPDAPPSSKRGKDLEEPPTSEDAPKKPKKAGGTPAKPPRRPADKKSESEKPAAVARTTEEPAGGFPTTWVVVAAVAAVTLWFLFFRNPNPDTPKTNDNATRPAPSLVTTTSSAAQPMEPAPTTTETASAAPAPVESAPPTEEPVSRPTDDKNKPKEKEEEKPPENEKEKEKPPENEKEKEKSTTPTASSTGTDVAMAPPFNASAAASAVASAAGAASSCRQEGDPSGTASVSVTFANSGRVTTATVNGPPFAGTKTGGCIAAALRGARVPAFSGDPVTVHKTVVIQ